MQNLEDLRELGVAVGDVALFGRGQGLAAKCRVQGLRSRCRVYDLVSRSRGFQVLGP